MYENHIRQSSINYINNTGTDNLSNDSVLMVNPNFKVCKFSSNIYNIINILRENKFDQLKNYTNNEENYMAIYAVATDNVLTIKIDKALVNVVEKFNQPKKYSEFIGDDNLCKALKQLVERKVLIEC